MCQVGAEGENSWLGDTSQFHPRKLEGPQEGSRVLTVGGLRRMLTGRGKMPMTNAEVPRQKDVCSNDPSSIPSQVDDLVGRVFPGQTPLGRSVAFSHAIVEESEGSKFIEWMEMIE